MPEPKKGLTVIYALSKQNVEDILSQRRNGKELGTRVIIGEKFPAIITRINANEFRLNQHGVNLKVILDGTDTLWVMSRKYDPGGVEGTWCYLG